MPFEWTETIRENLIDLVEPVPSLWDKDNSMYRDTNLNTKHWKRIGKFLGCSDNDAIHEFKLLKRRFVHQKRKEETNSKNGIVPRRSRTFIFADKLKFLDLTLVRRNPIPVRCVNIGELSSIELPFAKLSPLPLSHSEDEMSKTLPGESSVTSNFLSENSLEHSNTFIPIEHQATLSSMLEQQALSAVKDAAISQNAAVVVEDKENLTKYQKQFIAFMTTSMGILSEQNQKQFMNQVLEFYLILNRD